MGFELKAHGNHVGTLKNNWRLRHSCNPCEMFFWFRKVASKWNYNASAWWVQTASAFRWGIYLPVVTLYAQGLPTRWIIPPSKACNHLFWGDSWVERIACDCPARLSNQAILYTSSNHNKKNIRIVLVLTFRIYRKRVLIAEAIFECLRQYHGNERLRKDRSLDFVITNPHKGSSYQAQLVKSPLRITVQVTVSCHGELVF